MATPSPTLLPRLDILFDHRTPWSAEKFAEAIKLHAVLLWPDDGPRQNQRAAVLLARHRKRALRIVSAKVGRHFLSYSEMKKKIERDLDVLHSRLMSKGEMRRMLKEQEKDDPNIRKLLKQGNSMRLAVCFVKFALSYHADLRKERPLSKELFLSCASRMNYIKTGRGYSRSNYYDHVAAFEKFGHLLYADSLLVSGISRPYLRRDVESGFAGGLEEVGILKNLPAYALCISRKLAWYRSDWFGKDDLERLGGERLKLAEASARVTIQPPPPFSERELRIIGEFDPETQKPGARRGKRAR